MRNHGVSAGQWFCALWDIVPVKPFTECSPGSPETTDCGIQAIKYDALVTDGKKRADFTKRKKHLPLVLATSDRQCVRDNFEVALARILASCG